MPDRVAHGGQEFGAQTSRCSSYQRTASARSAEAGSLNRTDVTAPRISSSMRGLTGSPRLQPGRARFNRRHAAVDLRIPRGSGVRSAGPAAGQQLGRQFRAFPGVKSQRVGQYGLGGLGHESGLTRRCTSSQPLADGGGATVTSPQ